MATHYETPTIRRFERLGHLGDHRVAKGMIDPRGWKVADGNGQYDNAGYRFRGPDGHVFELYHEADRYEPPEHLRPSLKNQPQRYVGRGAAV